MVLLMQGFFIISCEILEFPADNVRASVGKITACKQFCAGKLATDCLKLASCFRVDAGQKLFKQVNQGVDLLLRLLSRSAWRRWGRGKGIYWRSGRRKTS